MLRQNTKLWVGSLHSEHKASASEKFNDFNNEFSMNSSLVCIFYICMSIYTPDALVHYLYLPRAQRRRPNMMPLEHHLLVALLMHPIEDHHPKILRLIANHYRPSHSLLLCSDLFCNENLKLPFVFLKYNPYKQKQFKKKFLPLHTRMSHWK